MNSLRRAIASTLTLLSLAAFPLAANAPRPPAGGPRNVVVYFEFLDNGNGIEEAVAYLFERMIGPDDQLIILSPVRSYSFSRDTLAQPRAALIAMMQEKLRGDIARTAQGYKQVIGDLDAAAREIEELAYPTGAVDANKDMNELFILYRQALANLNQLRQVNEASLRRLAGVFRGHPGENHIIMLFEREFRPIPRREALNVLADTPQFAFQSNELFSTGNMKELFAVAPLAAAFKQVPLAQHFIYITSKNASATGNLFESSGDIYAAFSKLAQATGGVCRTISEPVSGLEAVLASWGDARKRKLPDAEKKGDPTL
jgi:hypothetical protein